MSYIYIYINSFKFLILISKKKVESKCSGRFLHSRINIHLARFSCIHPIGECTLNRLCVHFLCNLRWTSLCPLQKARAKDISQWMDPPIGTPQAALQPWFQYNLLSSTFICDVIILTNAHVFETACSRCMWRLLLIHWRKTCYSFYGLTFYLKIIYSSINIIYRYSE